VLDGFGLGLFASWSGKKRGGNRKSNPLCFIFLLVLIFVLSALSASIVLNACVASSLRSLGALIHAIQKGTLPFAGPSVSCSLSLAGLSVISLYHLRIMLMDFLLSACVATFSEILTGTHTHASQKLPFDGSSFFCLVFFFLVVCVANSLRSIRVLVITRFRDVNVCCRCLFISSHVQVVIFRVSGCVLPMSCLSCVSSFTFWSCVSG
jgi:hypothetical protein